jgi:hypothetical protein
VDSGRLIGIKTFVVHFSRIILKKIETFSYKRGPLKRYS